MNGWVLWILVLCQDYTWYHFYFPFFTQKRKHYKKRIPAGLSKYLLAGIFLWHGNKSMIAKGIQTGNNIMKKTVGKSVRCGILGLVTKEQEEEA